MPSDRDDDRGSDVEIDIEIDTPWQSPWRPTFIGTLLFLMQGDKVLLIHKKTGHGAGKINAPGGKLQAESIADCAIREMREETGLVVANPECRAELRFVEQNGPQWLGYAFTATQWSGRLIETREAKPFWCGRDEIPYAQMWPDDAIWLPGVLAGEPAIIGDFLFDSGELLAHEMRPMVGYGRVID